MFRIFTILSFVVALCVIGFGAYLSISGAGVGCSIESGCHGQALPGAASAPQSLVDNIQVLAVVHRYLALALGGLVLLTALLSWTAKHCRPAAIMGSFGLLLLLALQVTLGMIADRLQISPAVVMTGHLLLALFTFWLLYWLLLRANPAVVRLALKHGPRCLAAFAMLVLFLQIILGVWTSSNYAALACSGFPQCNGQWWPPADYRGVLDALQHFNSASQTALSPEVLVAINMLHRIGAVATFLVLALLSIVAILPRYPRRVRFAGIGLIILLLLEISLGAAVALLIAPMWTALLHTIVAALLMLPLIAIRFYSRYGIPVVAVPPVAELPAAPQEAAEEVIAREAAPEVYVEKAPETLYLRLRSQLKRTRSGLSQVLARIPLGQKTIDGELLEEIETSLIMADVGVDATAAIIAQLTDSVEREQLNDGTALTMALKQQLLQMLEPCDKPLYIPKQDKPFVILVVGVNGAGKTTTIGKLAKRLQAQGHSVMLAAGDTFRAAAVEQLQTWGERNGIYVVAQHTGADSASVIYDGVQSAYAKGIDVLIADTAGRLHTKSNLMDELKKIKRIMGKLDATAPHEVLLVLDAGTGQNALSQARLFNEAVELTGIALTKLDGTAKGGVIFALAKQFGLPIRFIGVGESIDDLQDFHAQQFVDALLATDE